MTETCPVPQTARIPDPREVLNAGKRARIIGMLTMGCSRRMAAKQVGCAASTITRTAERDEEFCEQIAEAESQADIRALRLIKNTAQQEKYWRVAAWVLERRNPEEYGRRAPHTFTGTHVTELLVRVLSETIPLAEKDKLADLLMIFHEAIFDVADKALLPPMDVEELLALSMPEPKEEAAKENKSEAANKQPEVSPQRPHLAPRDVRPAPAAAGKSPPTEKVVPSRNGSAATPLAEREENVSLAAVKPSAKRDECSVPRRTSCLEQFVTRTPKPELQTAGR